MLRHRVARPPLRVKDSVQTGPVWKTQQAVQLSAWVRILEALLCWRCSVNRWEGGIRAETALVTLDTVWTPAVEVVSAEVKQIGQTSTHSHLGLSCFMEWFPIESLLSIHKLYAALILFSLYSKATRQVAMCFIT